MSNEDIDNANLEKPGNVFRAAQKTIVEMMCGKEHRMDWKKRKLQVMD